MSFEATIHYKNQQFTTNFFPSDTLNTIFLACKDQFCIPEDAATFVFYTNGKKDITNDQIGNSLKLDEAKRMYLITKQDLNIINQFLANQYPSIRYESLSIFSPLMNVLTRLHSLHEAIYNITDETCAQMLSVLPHDEIKSTKDHQLVRVVVNWLANSFFQFSPDPVCHLCSEKTIFVGYQTPTQSEVEEGLQTAEKYQCVSCEAISRQLRTKNIQYLIQNPSGKADEASLLLYTALKSLKFSVRIVVNLDTNHTWVEFFSASLKRYIQADPIEQIVDEPLVYEKWWQHPHSRVVAIGVYECKDVTLKYTTLGSTDAVNILMKKPLTDLITLRNGMWNSSANEKMIQHLKSCQNQDDHKHDRPPIKSNPHPFISQFQ